mmetsp:Transcript_34703/g.74942  ORF Transcript_34703/g.74942 Transcript_34703/m.74942 type:complete len:85 (-) Transcript_34703:511-765(-)
MGEMTSFKLSNSSTGPSDSFVDFLSLCGRKQQSHCEDCRNQAEEDCEDCKNQKQRISGPCSVRFSLGRVAPRTLMVFTYFTCCL